MAVIMTLQGWVDKDTLIVDVFDHDWGRCSGKERFNKFIDKWTKGG
jgi:hypothetical protein